MADLSNTTTTIVTMVTSLLALFEVYPLNLVLTFALGGYAFRFFGQGRKAVAGPAK